MRTFLLLSFLFFFQNNYGQSNFSKRLSIGVANNSIFSERSGEQRAKHLFSPGIFSSFIFHDKIAMEIGLFFEKASYKIVDGTLRFGTGISSGGTSNGLTANVEESYLHLNHYFKLYLLKNKKVNPFIGLGYSIRFITKISGTRTLEEIVGVTTNLNPVEGFDKYYFHPGAHLGAGIDFFFNQKIMLTVQGGWNEYFKNNFSRYNPTINLIDDNGVKYSLNNIFIKVGIAYFFERNKKEI